MTRNRKFTQLTALAGLAALAACDSSTGAGMGTVRVYMTSAGGAAMVSSLTLSDPPSGTLTDPTVFVSSVELVPGRHEIATFDPVAEFALTPMDNGLGALLGTATVPAGEYEQLRLVLTGASVLFNGAEVNMDVPSGSSTGLKLNFSGPVQVLEGGETNLVIVLDLDNSFVVQGPPDAPEPRVSFKPVIHASVLPGASIEGNVTVDVAAGVGGRAVTVTASQGSAIASSTSVIVAEGGTTAGYAVRFLQAGTYTVEASATACTFVGTAPSATVTEGGTTSGVNLNLDC